LLSLHLDQIDASQKGATLFVGTLASVVVANKVRKFMTEVEKDNPLGNQDKVHRYLETKLDILQASRDINIPLVARLIYQSKGYTPFYKEYDTYIQDAFKLAELDNKQINMQHLEAAVHNRYGKKFNIIRDEIENRGVVIHELGHALAIIYKLHNAEILHCVEVEPRETKKHDVISLGHNVYLPIEASMCLPEEEWKNKIIVALSGGIAEQVISSDNNLQKLLSNEGCSGDMGMAYTYAKKIAIHNLLQKRLKQSYTRFIPLYNEMKLEFNMFTVDERVKIKEDVDKIIEECYEEAFNFIDEHKAQIELAVDMVLKKGSLSGDDLYDLWKFPKPLYDFEQGPLPKSLIKNYELRGYEPEVKG
jgi:hypothetical protein